MFDIEAMAEDVRYDTAWQSTPYPIGKEDYIKFVVHAIKKFFVDVNHPNDYNQALYTTTDQNVLVYDYTFDVVQEEYIYILSKMQFFKMVYIDLSGDSAISYTTNALSVTGAKEGFKSVQQTLDTLEQERIRVFHKMMARDTNET